MVPCPQKAQFPPSAWSGEEHVLPGKTEPYFLKANTGPAYLVGGTVVRPLATTAESGGKFAIGSIEGSARHALKSVFASSQRIRFSKVHHCLQVVDGSITFHVGDQEPTTLHAEELVYIPAGTEFRFDYASRSAKAYIFSNGGGLVELLTKLGIDYKGPIIPEKEAQWDGQAFSGQENLFSYEMVK